MSPRSRAGGATTTSTSPAKGSASSAAYAAGPSVIPGSISSYSACMIPSRPIRGRPSATEPGSALAVDVLVAVMEPLHVVVADARHLSQAAGEVDRARDVLAHHGSLERLPRAGPYGEDAVAAHQHRGGPRAGQRLDHAAADLLVADQ